MKNPEEGNRNEASPVEVMTAWFLVFFMIPHGRLDHRHHPCFTWTRRASKVRSMEPRWPPLDRCRGEPPMPRSRSPPRKLRRRMST